MCEFRELNAGVCGVCILGLNVTDTNVEGQTFLNGKWLYVTRMWPIRT
jgi:hypothetical protein